MAGEKTKPTRQYVPDVGIYYVRVLGTRLDRFVEFEFAINDPDQLMVELIMPFHAFEEFCRKYDAVELPPRNGGTENGMEPGLDQISDFGMMEYGGPHVTGIRKEKVNDD